MLKQFFRNSLLLALAAFVMAAAPDGGKKSQDPIVITSKRMDADELGSTVKFAGNVVLKKESMTLSSDTMVVFYDAGAKTIREVEAHGNVMVRKEGRVAHSNEASYFNREEKIIMTGDARINENDNEIGGDKITLFLRDDRSIIEGGKVKLYQDQQVKPQAKPQEKKKSK